VNLILARIDDRLIHGQVVVGCAEPAHADRILLADAEAAADPLQATLYRAAVPPSIQVEVLDPDAAVHRLSELEAARDPHPTILVAGSPATMLRMVEAGAPIEVVNLGGLHFHEGAREAWPGYYLDAGQRADLRALLRRGVRIEVQTVLGAPCLDARRLLEQP
jgi:PTS system mannose-specific IIB component